MELAVAPDQDHRLALRVADEEALITDLGVGDSFGLEVRSRELDLAAHLASLAAFPSAV
jgi:hypothetical protein